MTYRKNFTKMGPDDFIKVKLRDLIVKRDQECWNKGHITKKNE